MAMAGHVRPHGWAIAVAALASAALAGCGGGASLNPFTTGSAFSSANTVDRTFIGASQTWDLDKNGLVTCDEWKNYASTSFREADGNGDGALADDEFQAMAKNDRLFDIADLKYYDNNGDGRVAADELTGKPNRAFALLDKNGDCQIARDESVQTVQLDKKKEDTNTPEKQLERAEQARR